MPHQSGVHRLHPLTKLTLMGFALVGALALPRIWSNYLLFLFLLVPLGIWGKVLWALIDKVWRVTLPFAISVFLIQGFLWPHGTPIFWIGPFSLKQEGLSFAVASTGRILVVVSSFLWFAMTTRPDALMTSLSQRGFPSSLAYIIVATVQIIPRFQTRANTIVDAQRARGLETEGGLLRRLRAILPLVVPLILSSLVDVEERALAVEARGFSSPVKKISLVEVREARWEPAFRWILVAGMAAFVSLRFLL